jgi:hypothetical protein
VKTRARFGTETGFGAEKSRAQPGFQFPMPFISAALLTRFAQVRSALLPDIQCAYSQHFSREFRQKPALMQRNVKLFVAFVQQGLKTWLKA